MNEELLERGLEELKLLSERNLSLLTRYIKEIELFNPAYGLVKVRDTREFILKHILDSLAPFDIINSRLKKTDKAPAVADVGSGAGLPGIPLAICMPDVQFTLVERMGRRVGFLLNTVAALGLSNVQVEEKEMEKLVPACFDLVVLRAFRPLEDKILKSLLGLLGPDGILAAYKGRRQALEEEMSNLMDAGNKDKGPSIGAWELFPLKVPFLKEERHLLLIHRQISSHVDNLLTNSDLYTACI